MTEEQEFRAIERALLAWFESQDIALQDAAIAMSRILGAMIGSVSKSESDLEEGLDLHAQSIAEDARRVFRRIARS